MAELVFVKTPNGTLISADTQTQEAIRKLKIGKALKGEFKQMRDINNHRRMFALFNFAFDLWDAPELEHKGEPVQKNFDRFRKDMTILAGFYDVHVNIKGEIRTEAKSLSFGSMKEEEFQRVYKGILDVIWTRILRSKGYETPEQVDEYVHKLLKFEYGG